MPMKPCVLAAFVCLIPSVLSAQQQPTTPSDPSHHDAVTARGDHAMGFSHETTTHRFRLAKTGGVIDVSANDPKDSATREQIRMHLSHIAKRFSAGDFDVPMFIHDTNPPGASIMAKLRHEIRYRYVETDRGAKIQITTANTEAIGHSRLPSLPNFRPPNPRFHPNPLVVQPFLALDTV
jgi:hypothetical protein